MNLLEETVDLNRIQTWIFRVEGMYNDQWTITMAVKSVDLLKIGP